MSSLDAWRNDRRPSEDYLESPLSVGRTSILIRNVHSTVWAPEMQLSTSAIITDEREHEMAYLIRHFTEAIGPW